MLDYLKPAECYFTREDILFILNNCLEGWPDQGSSKWDMAAAVSACYTDHMPGETAILIVAEIKARVEMCGKAGERLLVAFQVAQPDQLVFDCLSDESKAVMNYISGKCRRVNSCDKCPEKMITSDKKKTSKICERLGRRPCTWSQWVNRNRYRG